MVMIDRRVMASLCLTAAATLQNSKSDDSVPETIKIAKTLYASLGDEDWPEPD